MNVFKDFLINIFTHLEHCNFDKAKELCVTKKGLVYDTLSKYGTVSKKEREFSHLFLCAEILTVLPRIIEAEKCYFELNYLCSKERVLLRRDHSLQHMYDAIKEKLSYIQESNSSNELTTILNDIIKFVAIRIKLIDLYDSLYMLSLCNKHIKFEDLTKKVKLIKENHLDHYVPSVLVCTKNTLQLEINCLDGLLCAQLHLQNWQNLSCINNLHVLTNNLNSWLKILQSKEIWKFLRTNNTLPELYHWMVQFRIFLLDKFSLYFYMLFRQEIPANELKIVCNKHKLDFVKRFQNLIQFCNPGEMCIAMLIFDAAGLKNWYGPGFQYLPRTADRNATNHSYYIMMRHPEKLSQPCTHLPAIKRIILEHFAELLFLDKVVCAHLDRENCTYFITNIEEKTSLVVYYNSKRDKNSEIVTHILNLASDLRCHRLFNALKTSPLKT